MIDLKEDLISLELARKEIKENYLKFTGAGTVFITTDYKTARQLKKDGIVIKKDSYYGYILEEFSCNGILQEVEDLVDEFIDKYPLLRKKVYLS